jgi:N-acetylmuramoyl-L-alanine amidase
MSMTIYKQGSRGELVKQIQRALKLYPDGIYGAITEEAVREFQASHGLKVDGMVGPATLARLLPTVVATVLKMKKSRRTINEIIVHCSATPEGKDYTVDDITRWHKQRGFTTIGYHYVVYRDGSIHEGRDVKYSGAHCTGHNANSIGVVYIGGVSKDGKTAKDTRTKAQKRALLQVMRTLRAAYPSARIYGHRDFAKKDCPSFDAREEYKSV